MATTRDEKGEAAAVIVETTAADKNTLIVMATHGRSGLNRFLLGSIGEKVLRATVNPLLLVKATEPVVTEGEAPLTSIVVPLDGSDLAGAVLPAVTDLARKLDLEVVLVRAYAIPYGAYSTGDGFYDPLNLRVFLYDRLRKETFEYLERTITGLKRNGVAKVSFVAKEGPSADRIIKFARETPANLIAMSTMGVRVLNDGCLAVSPRRLCVTPAIRFWCCVPTAARSITRPAAEAVNNSRGRRHLTATSRSPWLITAWA